MRTLEGQLQLPADTRPGSVGELVVELRDVSQQDAPSRLLAALRLHVDNLQPLQRLHFRLQAPEGLPGAQLNLRAQLDADRTYLTTQAFPVPERGDARQLLVPLQGV